MRPLFWRTLLFTPTMLNLTWASRSWKTVKVKGIPPPNFVFKTWLTAKNRPSPRDLGKIHGCLLAQPMTKLDSDTHSAPHKRWLAELFYLHRSVRTKYLLIYLWLWSPPSFPPGTCTSAHPQPEATYSPSRKQHGLRVKYSLIHYPVLPSFPPAWHTSTSF